MHGEIRICTEVEEHFHFQMTIKLGNHAIALLLVLAVFLIGIHGVGLTSKSN